MITLLAKRWIQNREDVASPRVRTAYGMLCGAVGIFFNLLLTVGKLIAGRLSGSIAVTADALNNLSDAGSSAVSLAGFRMAGNKADSEHPFGHGRIEYIAGLVVSMAILLMGVELLKSSAEKIFAPETVTFSWVTAGVLAASILVKLYMFLYNRRIGGKIGSPAMRATALDSLSDVAATAVVLLCTFVQKWTGFAADAYAGTAVALFILYTGVKSVMDTVGPLLGEPPTQAYVDRIEQLVMAHPEVVGVHDLIVHDYGPGRAMISLHAEVPANGDFIHLHDAIDNIEKELREALGCAAVIHMDPVVTDDVETNRLHRLVDAVVHCIDPRLSIHDFRIVAGPTHTNLVFDLVVPYAVKLTDEEVRARINTCIRDLGEQYYAVIDIDKTDLLSAEKPSE